PGGVSNPPWRRRLRLLQDRVKDSDLESPPDRKNLVGIRTAIERASVRNTTSVTCSALAFANRDVASPDPNESNGNERSRRHRRVRRRGLLDEQLIDASGA